MLNANVRNAAIPVPPARESLPKICWFHRQFGQASVNCLQPCEFKALAVATSITNPVPSQAAPKPQISSVVVRMPFERNTKEQKIVTSSSSCDSDASSIKVRPSSSKDLQAKDWNAMMESHPKLSDSSKIKANNKLLCESNCI